jgi:hypothetical protein
MAHPAQTEIIWFQNLAAAFRSSKGEERISLSAMHVIQ